VRGEGSEVKRHAVFQAAQSLTATEIDSKDCRSVKKTQTLLLSLIPASDTPFKKADVPSFLFGGGCLHS